MSTQWSIPLVVVSLLLSSCTGSDTSNTDTDATSSGGSAGSSYTNPIEFFLEEIPGSDQHANATWWGFNQKKITRYQDKVFMYVMENPSILNDDGEEIGLGTMRLYIKDGLDGTWQPGAGFETSRPGCLLVDADGRLHVFAIDINDISQSNQVGPLMHHTFTNAHQGDITNYESTTVVPATTDEGINIRFGAAIGVDGTMVIGFGQDDGDGEVDKQEAYYRGPNDTSWTRNVASNTVLYNMYYTMVVVTEDGYGLFSGMDDSRPDGGTAWNLLTYFEYDGESWTATDVVDETEHTNDDDYGDHKVEQHDLYLDAGGRLHFVWRDPNGYKHQQKEGGSWSDIQELDFPQGEYVRVFEIDDEVYFVTAVNREVYFNKLGHAGWNKIVHGNEIDCVYNYASVPAAGTSLEEDYLDLTILAGCAERYQEQSNYYLRIAKDQIAKLF